MDHSIEPIGFEGTKNIGKMILQTNSILVILNGEEIPIPLTIRNRDEFFYLDFIENKVNSFHFVCHIVRSSGIEKDVVGTFFLREEKELTLLREFMDNLNRQTKEEFKEKVNTAIKKTAAPNGGKGWLSKRRY